MSEWGKQKVESLWNILPPGKGALLQAHCVPSTGDTQKWRSPKPPHVCGLVQKVHKSIDGNSGICAYAERCTKFYDNTEDEIQPALTGQQRLPEGGDNPAMDRWVGISDEPRRQWSWKVFQMQETKWVKQKWGWNGSSSLRKYGGRLGGGWG